MTNTIMSCMATVMLSQLFYIAGTTVIIPRFFAADITQCVILRISKTKKPIQHTCTDVKIISWVARGDTRESPIAYRFTSLYKLSALFI